MESCACTTSSAMIVLCAALSSEHIFSVDTFCPVGCSLCRFFSPFTRSLVYVVSPLCRMHIMRANVALKLHVNSPNYRRNAIHIRNIHIILFAVHARLSSVYLCFVFVSLSTDSTYPFMLVITVGLITAWRTHTYLYRQVDFISSSARISREKTAERRG